MTSIFSVLANAITLLRNLDEMAVLKVEDIVRMLQVITLMLILIVRCLKIVNLLHSDIPCNALIPPQEAVTAATH